MFGDDLFSIILIAIGLSADCFAVSLSAGISNKNHSWLQIFRVAFSFGLFQALMPVLGWLAGITIVDFIADYDHWVAFVLLAIVSGRMFWEAFHSKDGQEKEIDISRGFILLTLSIATSIDALAIGLSFAFLKIDIALASPIIGAIAFIVTTIGFILGKRASKLIGKRAEAIGALILLGIAFRILLSHIL
ncbi:manganese efflux pump MntP family protein [Chloroflexota bacterium]